MSSMVFNRISSPSAGKRLTVSALIVVNEEVSSLVDLSWLRLIWRNLCRSLGGGGAAAAIGGGIAEGLGPPPMGKVNGCEQLGRAGPAFEMLGRMVDANRRALLRGGDKSGGGGLWRSGRLGSTPV